MPIKVVHSATAHSKVSNTPIMLFTLFRRKQTILTLCALFAVTSTNADCNKFECKGPTRHYEDLKCKPMYANSNDCCPVRYDCSHLEERSVDKCYANGHEYAIGEKLRDEDYLNPCDVDCTCHGYLSESPEFKCASMDCQLPDLEEGCYFQYDRDSCCSPGIKCLNDNREELSKCEVDGKTYYEGQEFFLNSRPDLHCVCMDGFKGEYVEPFCKQRSCGTEIKRFSKIRENCAPIFHDSAESVTSCARYYTCQNDYHGEIQMTRNEAAGKKPVDGITNKISDDMKCRYGNLTMDVGDKLSRANLLESTCVSCLCEVPPTPTCLELSDEECKYV